MHAHPDDESLFTGHVIADRLLAGGEVYVLTLTRGERGKMKLEELKGLEGQLGSMGAFRAGELRVALDALREAGGKLHHSFAGTRKFLDSGMRISALGKPTKKHRLDEMSLAAAGTSVIAEDILNVIKEFKPDAIITYNAKGGFGHPDHKKAHQATAMAIRQYRRARKGRGPQFWVIADANERYDIAVGSDKTAKFKKAALEAHASQVTTDEETYSVSANSVVRYDAPELLRRANPSPLVHLRPMLTVIWATPLGILLGLAGTLLHSIKTTDANEFPIGLVVAFAMVFALFLALRILRNSRGALYLTSLVFIGTVFWLAQRQPGGEVLILGNQIGDIWAYGSIIICAIIVMFPKLHPSTWRRGATDHR